VDQLIVNFISDPSRSESKFHPSIIFAIGRKINGLDCTSMDRLTALERSRLMASIRSTDTQPEKLVRSLLHHLGFRFRLHRKDLPGTPDLILMRYKTAIFIHGCFWHRHLICKDSTIPKTNTEFWTKKFNDNLLRDKRSTSALKDLGWRVLVVWECETKDLGILADRLTRELSDSSWIIK
jgi:DNA mismatch endonuclease, patch repair protein